jgi:hypothetical protein
MLLILQIGEEFDTWKDVGLDTTEPPPILSLYRYFFDNEDSGIQVTFDL